MRVLVVGVSLAVGLGCGGDDGSGGGADGAVTTAVRQDLTLSTSDGKGLTGYLAAAPASPAGRPGVVLVHQFQRDDEQWGDFPDVLAESGYRTLAFNLRGHGDSDPYDGSLVGILSDPVAAPADLAAALDYIQSDGQADPSRIAVIGTSIGANLAVSAAINDQASTYVSVSSRIDPAETFAGSPATTMSSVFYLAGQNDPGGQAVDAQTLFDATADPKQIQIYSATSDHGIAILDNQADARQLIVDWLGDNL